MKRTTEVDLQRIEARQQYDVPRTDGSKQIYMPIGCPVDVALHVRSTEGPNTGPKRVDLDIEGFTMVESWYTFGVKFYIKYQRKEQTLSLWIDEGEGPRKVEEWQR